VSFYVLSIHDVLELLQGLSQARQRDAPLIHILFKYVVKAKHLRHLKSGLLGAYLVTEVELGHRLVVQHSVVQPIDVRYYSMRGFLVGNPVHEFLKISNYQTNNITKL
jgi:hypothetical protein